MDFTLTNNKGKEIEFRFIASGAPYGLSAINKGESSLGDFKQGFFKWFYSWTMVQ
jgi:hypothetical protein